MVCVKYAAAFAVLLSASACEKSTQQKAAPVYYDVAGYVDAQIATLAKAKPAVTKRAQMAGTTQHLKLTTLNWSRELELFKQADINKPALRQSYAIARPDSLTYLYTLKPTEKNLTVRRLMVQLDSATRQPRRIEATLATENPLYNSERRIVLESGPNQADQWGIRHYRLSGFQHLVIADKKAFDVEGTVQ
ncbi:hypothetical protein ACAW74_13025 [Fibrella sp. WM1]|uniref:hypothetical protein n=1 Tax=Fibrella musci TaxID=3242485 RepID=UPI0035219704